MAGKRSTRTSKSAPKHQLGLTAPPSQPSSTHDLLSSIPPEILQEILDNIRDLSTISKLGRTCKRYHSLLMPSLYNRVIVAAAYHAHIPKLIRTLEPLLTITQKKQLKKEGKYKGQQERYATHLDEESKPTSVNHVRQMLVGHSDPGKKHRYIVDRYVEETFKNLDHLEVVETHILTKSMGEKLASLQKLQALCLISENFEADAMKPLAGIKNLKHLNVHDRGYGEDIATGRIIQSIISNSVSTLRSLVVEANLGCATFLKGWQGNMSAGNTIPSSCHDLGALESLTLTGISFEPATVISLNRAINFLGLRELTLGSFSYGDHLFFQHLASLTSSPEHSASSVRLRSLNINMSEDNGSYYRHTNEDKQATFVAKCQFIASLNTLTTLTLCDYHQYPKEIMDNPGLSDILLQAILKHQNLRTLKIPYPSSTSNRKNRYLSARTVAAIVDNLPELQEFEFTPEEGELEEIGRALARGANLRSISCYPIGSTWNAPPGQDLELKLLSSILRGLPFDDDDGKVFIWEEHSNLKRVKFNHRDWEIASAFGEVKKSKSKKGVTKPEKLSVNSERREILYRPIQHIWDRDVGLGYLPSSEWVEGVCKDLN